MKLFLLTALMVVVCLGFGLLISCGGDDDDDNDDNDATDDDAADDDAADDDDNGGECTAEAMCQFSLDCNLGFTSLEECLTASEEQLQTCPNADGYATCICDCFLAGPSCAEYVGCGLECYGQFCQ